MLPLVMIVYGYVQHVPWLFWSGVGLAGFSCAVLKIHALIKESEKE